MSTQFVLASLHEYEHGAGGSSVSVHWHQVTQPLEYTFRR